MESELVKVNVEIAFTGMNVTVETTETLMNSLNAKDYKHDNVSVYHKLFNATPLMGEDD